MATRFAFTTCYVSCLPLSSIFRPYVSQPILIYRQLSRYSMPNIPTTTMTSVADLRVNYSKQGLDEATLPHSPFQLFSTWFSEATSAQEHEPNAMCLATADSSGRPSARMVLLKAFDTHGFVWYTNYSSRKSEQLSSNPFAALTFWWPTMERSVRIEGPVLRVSEQESDEYFNSRPPASRLGAWVSEQSQSVEQRKILEDKWSTLRNEHLDENGECIKDIQRPPFWGGFRLIPERIEFWKGREARLHDRIVYERSLPETNFSNVEDKWSRTRLQP